MGQATLELSGDLPDPLDLQPVDHALSSPVSAAALASADDLLSQLAGEDIDRLLAEAEKAGSATFGETPSNEASPAAAETLATTPLIETKSSAIDAPNSDIATATAEPIAVEAQDAAVLQAMIQPVMERVIDPVFVPPLVPPLVPLIETPLATPNVTASNVAASTVAVPPALVAAPTIPDASAQAASGVETTHAEVAALRANDAAVDEHPIHEPTPSALVRVLQVVNAPMSWLSDAVRDTLGKVALLTLFNAVAVLVYVLVFRRHGH